MTKKKTTEEPKLFDFIKMISQTKEIPEFDEHFEKNYSQFVVNRFFSLFQENSAILANEMNKGKDIPSKQHFLFLHSVIRKSSRFTKWPKKIEDKKINFLMEVYEYSFQKAKSCSDLINDDQIKELEAMFYEGGVGNKGKAKTNKSSNPKRTKRGKK